VSGELDDAIAQRARFADLLILGQFDTENPPTLSAFLLPARVVFGAATPILMVPESSRSSVVGRNVMVTRDGSRDGRLPRPS
jgi:hypothetical protein